MLQKLLLLVSLFVCVFAEETKKAKTELVKTLTDANVYEELEKSEINLVDFYAEWCEPCKQLTPEFEKAAKIIKEYKLPVQFNKIEADANPNTFADFRIPHYPNIYFLQDRKFSVMTQQIWKAQNIVSFVFSMLGSRHVTGKEYKEYAHDADRNVTILFRNESDTNEEYVKTFRETALLNKESGVMYVEMDCKDGTGQKLLKQYFGFNATDFPQLMYIRSDIIVKYKYEDNLKEITNSELSKFVHDSYENNIKRYFMGQPPIPADKQGDVIEVVAENFEEIILDATKNVFVDFYVPWCSFCRAAMDVLDEVAQLAKQQDDLVIAKFNFEANENKFPIERYPTGFFFPKDKSKWKKYTGDQNYQDIVNYIQKQLKENGETPLNEAKKKEVNKEKALKSDEL